MVTAPEPQRPRDARTETDALSRAQRDGALGLSLRPCYCVGKSWGGLILNNE